VSKIAAIEIEVGQWGDLITILDGGVKQTANPGLRQASLETLGYVCEEVPTKLGSFSNIILMAIASGMSASETNNSIRLAATQCLFNAMEFIKDNMAREADRNQILNMIFSVTQPPADEPLRVAAFQCLVGVADMYYEYLPAYMGPIFELTTKAIKNEPEDVVRQAIELWATICDVELEIEAEDADNADKQPPVPSRSLNIIKQAVAPLTPVLLGALNKQADDPEDDDFTVGLAAATALGLCAQVAKDLIVKIVLDFVQQNVNSAEWRAREAAILAFGCILDGPNRDELAKVVKQAFQLILSKMNDPHAMVKDTTSWTLGRICLLLPEAIDPSTLPPLMAALQQALSAQQTAKVASNASWAIHNLASSVEAQDSSPLSPYFQPLLQALLGATLRRDVKQSNLQVSIYEAINALVASATADVLNIIQQILPHIMQSLQTTIGARAESAEDKQALNEVQALLCGTLQAIVSKLATADVLPHAQTLMQLLLQVVRNPNTTVLEEGLMAIGAVADKLGDQFAPFTQEAKAPLLAAITNAQEYHACKVAIYALCDVTRAIGAHFTLFSDEVMALLLRHLSEQTIERSLKTCMIECMGDVATAVGGFFERYLKYVCPMLQQASQINFAADDYDNQEYLQQLREAILSAYAGILSGLDKDKQAAVFVNQPGLIESIAALVDAIAKDGQTQHSGHTQNAIEQLSFCFHVLTSLSRPLLCVLLLFPQSLTAAKLLCAVRAAWCTIW
jgi:importin subunit beta-1